MKNISVIGAGMMGRGIVHTFAQFDYTITWIDISDQALEIGLESISKNLDKQIDKNKLLVEDKIKNLSHIKPTLQLKSGCEIADSLIESVTENLSLKLKLFKELDEYCNQETILASNTSSISITKIASVTQYPDRVIGMHFMNPVPVMKLVEVIRGYATSDTVTRNVMELAKKISKTPAQVQDYPGFVSNRILIPMINEAIYCLYEGVAPVEEIDTVMKLGMAHPMGPLQLADFIGLDVRLAILNVLFEGFKNPKYAPCPLLVNLVTAGNWGLKTGKGFYDYIQINKKNQEFPEKNLCN